MPEPEEGKGRRRPWRCGTLEPCLPSQVREETNSRLERGGSEPRLPSIRVQPRRGSVAVARDPSGREPYCLGSRTKDDESRVPRTKNLATGKGPA